MTQTRLERTRARLELAALRLFEQNGFDATTVNEIARSAGVSHMTFFRYFPSKDSVLVDDLHDPLIAGSVLAQDPRATPIEQVRLGLLAAWVTLSDSDEAIVRSRVRLIAGHPRLSAAARQSMQRTEDCVVEALASRGVSPLDSRVAAGACLGALMAAMLHWGATEDRRPLAAVMRAALDQLKLQAPLPTPLADEADPFHPEEAVHQQPWASDRPSEPAVLRWHRQLS